MSSSEKFAQRVGKALNRRSLFERVGAGAVGVVAAVLGLAQQAEAGPGGCHNVLCCCVCIRVPVGTACSGPIYCTWIWTCCSGGRQYRCIEGYGHQVACPPSGACNQYIECSGVLATGNRC